tara:strand:+ start:358 stop:558 length:201 start_codon:yes stop_codon:yes gene_type:complete
MAKKKVTKKKVTKKKGYPKKTKHIEFIGVPDSIIEQVFDELAKTIPEKPKKKKKSKKKTTKKGGKS